MDLPITWKIIATADPNEFGFQTFHDPDKFVAWSTAAGNDGRPIDGVTLYKDWKFREPKRADVASGGIWGNYVFYKSSVTGDGVLVLTWLKYKSEDDKKIAFHSWREFGNHYWHGVLRRVSFFEDKAFPLSTQGSDGGIVVAARLYDRIEYDPPISEGTLFQHDLFLSPTKFNIGPLQVPIPTAVQWDYHGSRGSFPECLHPKLIFPPIRSAYASYTTGGGTVSVGGAVNGQVFPATNFEDRQPYFLKDSQQETEAGWLRHRIRVNPPAPPDTIRR